MKKGGYQILDLGGVDVGTAAATIAGTYGVIENGNGKPILVSGLNDGSKVYRDFFANAVKGDDLYLLPIDQGYNLKVTKANAVSIQAVA